MRGRIVTGAIIVGSLAAIGTVSYVLQKPLIHTGSAAVSDPDELRLHGTIRDFSESHPDFDVVPDQGLGHYAGNVALQLGAGNRPAFIAPGGDDAGLPWAAGYDSPYPALQDRVEEEQIATRIDLPVDAALLSITAYVGMKDKDVRYAIYSDAGGEPGVLLAETTEDESEKDEMEWLTMGVPETPLTAGTYWLALAFENKDQAYAYEPTGGTTRVCEYDAADDGFLSAWGATTASSTRRISIYGTFSTDVGADLAGDGGFKVLSEWTDAQSRPIAPHLFGAGVGGDDPIDFDIVDQGVIPQEPFAVKVTVLGAAIQTGSDGYHMPVTMKMHVGSQEFEPFGPYQMAVAGNVNDNQEITGEANGTNPRSDVIAEVFSPETPIWVTGRSWKRINSDVPGTVEANWEPKMTASTLNGGSQVWVLRDGDPVPDVDGLYDQDSIAEYVGDYVNQNTGTMSLGVNEIIYLFEVGESGDSSTADFQDLVVVITLAADPGDFPEGPELCGQPLADSEGTAGPLSSGGITSQESFGQWYRDVLGTNLSALHTITLTRNAAGVFEYLDPAFYPVDGRLLGNEGLGHNHHFTYTIKGTFTYERCAGQFVDFEGADDAWLFIDRRLVMDLGGVVPGTNQHVPIDRLGLENGERYDFHFFYARRQTGDAEFRLRTNIHLATPNTPRPVTGGYD